MELEDIRQLLEGEGLIGAIEKPSADTPLEQLIVVLEREDGRKLGLQIAFLPDEDAEIEHARLLQFFVGLDEVPPSAVGALHRRLGEVNRSIPLGAFHFHDQVGAVYFRHVSPVPRGNVPAIAPVVVETVWLVDFIMDAVLDRVLGVAAD